MIAQQIRNAVFNKTFYEVYNADDGRAWRWPAQTWNAIAYISLLLSGVFGLKKDIEGIWFEGFIPTVLSEIRIFNLRERLVDLILYVGEVCRHYFDSFCIEGNNFPFAVRLDQRVVNINFCISQISGIQC